MPDRDPWILDEITYGGMLRARTTRPMIGDRSSQKRALSGLVPGRLGKRTGHDGDLHHRVRMATGTQGNCGAARRRVAGTRKPEGAWNWKRGKKVEQ